MATAEKGASGKRRGMGRLEDMMPGSVDKGFLPLCEPPSEKEDYPLLII